MIDPLPAPPLFVRDTVQPIADRLGLQTLPLHAHEILLASIFYHYLNTYLSPALSTWAFPEIYPQLPPRTALNWNIHVVSLVQSVFICSCALWVLLMDDERKRSDAEGRIWGYNGAAGMTQAFAAGYFFWDAMVSMGHIGLLGWGSLIHALSALVIVTLGFRPFANHYGIAFVLYELSTPFLNFHWFFDKCRMTGSRVQLYNGIILILVFFGCRLVWGMYLSAQIYQDMWSLHTAPASEVGPTATLVSSSDHEPRLWPETTQRYGDKKFPLWMLYLYFGSNTILTILNFYWFWQMIQAIRKRFPESKRTKAKRASQ